MSFDLRSGIGAFSMLAALGCAPHLETYPPPIDCPVGMNCTVISGGGAAGSGGADGGTEAGGATTEVTGSVVKLISQTFNDAAPVTFAGAATILAPGPAGTLSAMYGGSAG